MITKYNLEELLKLHEDGWLKMNKYKDQLYIFCYSPSCQYEKYWNPLTLAMRGMVLGKNGEVVGQSLPKFFNLMEVEETKPENLPKLSYEIFQKLDGSYIQTFWNPYEERWQHTSKCSFDNEYIDAAYKFLPPEVLDKVLSKDECLVSEVRFEEDPMPRVTDTPPGLYIITSFTKEENDIVENPFSYSLELATKLKIGNVEKYNYNLDSKIDNFRSDIDTEGYVVRFSNGFRTKLKTDWYLNLNKLIDGFTESTIRETIKTYLINNDMSMDWIKHIPDELWEQAKNEALQILQDYNEAIQRVDSLYAIHYHPNRKDFALAVKDLPEASALFSKYSGKEYHSKIWKLV